VCSYDSRHEWWQHELEAHRITWQCIEGCQKVFTAQSDFDFHIENDHEDLITMLPTIRRTSARSAAMTKQENCPICQRLISLRGLQKHLASHQQQLALFALPPNLNETDNDENSNDSVSVDGGESNDDITSTSGNSLGPDHDHASDSDEFLPHTSLHSTQRDISNELQSSWLDEQSYPEVRTGIIPSTHLTRGSDDPFADQIEKAALKNSRMLSAYSDSGSSSGKESGKESGKATTPHHTTMSSATNDEIRLRTEDLVPTSVQLSGDMEGRTLQLVPAENGMVDLIINGGGSEGRGETAYRMPRESTETEPGLETFKESLRSKRRQMQEIKDNKQSPTLPSNHHQNNPNKLTEPPSSDVLSTNDVSTNNDVLR
jgi:hypothetical protein